jgi:predicted small integral membrane protein
LSPALPGSALLFALAFVCMLAGNWISQITAPTTTHPEVTMETAKSDKKLGRRLFFNTVTAAFATAAIGLVGFATAG